MQLLIKRRGFICVSR